MFCTKTSFKGPTPLDWWLILQTGKTVTVKINIWGFNLITAFKSMFSPRLWRMVVHHVDDPARRVEGGGGWKGNAEVTGMEPQATAGGRCRLRLRIIVLDWKLWFRDAFGASRNDPPLLQRKMHFSYVTWHLNLNISSAHCMCLCSSQELTQWSFNYSRDTGIAALGEVVWKPAVCFNQPQQNLQQKCDATGFM